MQRKLNIEVFFAHPPLDGICSNSVKTCRLLYIRIQVYIFKKLKETVQLPGAKTLVMSVYRSVLFHIMA
jgi:hypothetical protein